jgi:hypothetical protein
MGKELQSLDDEVKANHKLRAIFLRALTQAQENSSPPSAQQLWDELKKIYREENKTMTLSEAFVYGVVTGALSKEDE